MAKLKLKKTKIKAPSAPMGNMMPPNGMMSMPPTKLTPKKKAKKVKQ